MPSRDELERILFPGNTDRGLLDKNWLINKVMSWATPKVVTKKDIQQIFDKHRKQYESWLGWENAMTDDLLALLNREERVSWCEDIQWSDKWNKWQYRKPDYPQINDRSKYCERCGKARPQ